jgi:hypothetical protein
MNKSNCSIYILLLPLFLFSCDKHQPPCEISPAKKIEYYQGKEISKIPKVAIVESIYGVSDAAVEECWSRQIWLIRFGQPSRSEVLDEGIEVIEYYDPGPYQPPIARYFLSRAYIKLINDKTVSISYSHTSLDYQHKSPN